jgi:SET domain-containing protein
MIVVKTKLDRSLISGIGLFADQDIMKGDLIWKMTSISSFQISPDKYKELLQIEKDFIIQKDYYWMDDDGNYLIPLDDSRFVNHSNNPNIIEQDENSCVASRNIKQNEELTIDYKILIPKELWEPYMTENKEEAETQMIPIVPALTLGGIINASVSGIVSFIAVYFFAPIWNKIINYWKNNEIR